MTAPSTANVAILGASRNPDRYAWLALQRLKESGHRVFPVSARETAVDGIPAYRRLTDIPAPIHTVTVYLSPPNLAGCVDDLLTINPTRVIFNPGSETPEVMKALADRGVEVEAACTLVMLRTGQF